MDQKVPVTLFTSNTGGSLTSLLTKRNIDNSVIETKLLARWAQSIINHFYWSINSCDGNGKALVERFTSLKHHIVNRHKFEHQQYYKECAHTPLDDQCSSSKEWLTIGI